MRTDLNAMTFGVELETTIPYDVLMARGWRVGGYHCGAPIPGHDGWVAMHDSSIHARRPHVGAEIVSPVLSGPDGIASIERMVATLNEMGARVNRSTGFHVHIGWTGTPEQLRRLICFVAHHEKALFASTGTHAREASIYCSSIRTSYRPLETLNSEAEALRMQRYHVLNLQNLRREPGRRTVEFRVFAGTLNIEKILAYVQLCLGMVQKALDTPRKPLPWDTTAIARKRRASVGDGLFALQTLFTALVWREKTPPNGRTAVGVLTKDRIGALKAQLVKMAKQYDERAGGVR